ncbi:nicotinate phosphoribosyltransferase, partial [Motilimonas sp. 1_MG-2023]|nr:nicotinate phosphoribosyltransferase [Motilimonas sp. 1_MG-2023]
MQQQSPTGILSVVIDTWDFWTLVTDYLTQLKQDIMARDGNLVIRPDSVDQVKILTGYQVHA